MLRSIAIAASAVVLTSLAPVATLGAADEQPELTYGDLRLAGGFYADHPYDASLSLVAGNIGEKDPHATDAWADAGIVLGLRVMANRVPVKLSVGGPEYKARLVGGELMLGLGIYLDEEDHMEILIGYGKGQTSDITSSSLHRNGSFTSYNGELGLYHTFFKHYQVGGTLGYSYDKVKIDGVEGSFTGKANGVDLDASIGYRF
jgi:hypothetical protein